MFRHHTDMQGRNEEAAQFGAVGCEVTLCQGEVKTRALQFLWKHESDVIWDNRRPKWIFFVCTPTASARHSPPLQRGLFTLHSLFDTRATVQPLPLCQTLHARFPALTASNWILMCSWRPPPSSGRSFLKAIAGTKSGKEQRMREMATV